MASGLRLWCRRNPGLAGVAGGLTMSVAVWIVTEYLPEDAPEPERVGPLASSEFQVRGKSPEHPEAIMREELAHALGYTGAASAPERIRMLLNLREALTPDEIRELLQALLAKGTGSASSDVSTQFHEMANMLHRQPVKLDEFARVLATVARDSARPMVTRDYALQHLRRIWEKADQGSRLRKAITATMLEMLSTAGDLKPTLLLTLHLIAPRGSGSGEVELERQVAGILTQPSDGEQERIRLAMAAARIAGERRMVNQRQPLLRIASSGSEHALVRMAAIAALGGIGDAADLAALKTLAPHDERIAGAIRHAVASTGRP